MNESSPNSERVLKFVAADERPRFYEFSSFCLDSVDLQLFRSGELVPLPPKTIETLLVLLQRHGQLVTKELLIGTLWPDTFVEEGNLAQQIFRLRKALGDDSDSERYIENVPRRGYRFVATVTETETPSVKNVPARRATAGRRSMIVSIAAAVIVAALAVFLTRHTHASAPPPKPVSPGAQEAYLKGLYHFSRRTTPDFRKAEEYFRSAVEQEPRFARAWANLANVYGFLGESPRAKIAAQRALEIDERTAEAHAALGLTSLLYDFDWPSADRHFKRAIELDPSYATAHHWYAFDLVAHRKFDAALREIERARKLDPTSLIINTDVAQILLYARRYDQAIAKAREVVALDSNFEQAHQVLTEAYLRSGDRESATDELRSHPNPCLSGKLAADIGDKSEALALLHQMEQMFHRNQQLGVDFLIARLQAMVGNDESSIDWLEKSLALHDANVAMVAVDPSFDSLRGRQRFQAFLRRMKLSESLD